MTTLSALLVLGQGALLAGSWWVARALRGGGRAPAWLLWPSLAVSVAGSVPELGASLAGLPRALADGTAMGGMAVLTAGEAGLGAIAGHRAVLAARLRARLSSQAGSRLAAGDAAFAAGSQETARQAYQQQVAAAQGAGDEAAIRVGLSRVAWLDYVEGRFSEARAGMGWAAGAGRVDEAVGSEVVLLAGCLALAGGRLEVARPAIEDAGRLAEAAHDASQAALARLALGCEHYLEGWSDSGRGYIEAQAGAAMQTFDRTLAGTLLIALALAARQRGSAPDAAALGKLAEPLVRGHAVLAPLAAHVQQPEASPWLEKPAAALRALVLPAGTPAAVSGGR